jgi:hypothetical protein
MLNHPESRTNSPLIGRSSPTRKVRQLTTVSSLPEVIHAKTGWSKVTDFKAFRMRIGLVLIALGVLLSVIPDDWIETVFGLSPDNGNGLAEAALAGVPIATGCLLACDALVRTFRRTLHPLGVQASRFRR